MPRIWYEQGFSFSFYAADGGEPPHVHVSKGGARGKWWIDDAREQWSHGFKVQEKRAIVGIIRANRRHFIQRWNDFFPPLT